MTRKEFRCGQRPGACRVQGMCNRQAFHLVAQSDLQGEALGARRRCVQHLIPEFGLSRDGPRTIRIDREVEDALGWCVRDQWHPHVERVIEPVRLLNDDPILNGVTRRQDGIVGLGFRALQDRHGASSTS